MDDLFEIQSPPPLVGKSGVAVVLDGVQRVHAVGTIKANHYLRSVPSGKSHYLLFETAIVVWSIPANNNIDRWLLGRTAKVWELSRLWAPDGHDRNLLTRAISAAVKAIQALEHPDILVSYADPNAGHHGGIYKAASWIFDGQVEETRTYRPLAGGPTVARRAFHSGDSHLTKNQILAAGFEEIKTAGKWRFVKPLTKRAKKDYLVQRAVPGPR